MNEALQRQSAAEVIARIKDRVLNPQPEMCFCMPPCDGNPKNCNYRDLPKLSYAEQLDHYADSPFLEGQTIRQAILREEAARWRKEQTL